MEKIGYFIKKDQQLLNGDLDKIDFSTVILVAKDGASYVIFTVNGSYMDTPYRGDYSKSKITASQFKNLFTGENARYISLEKAIMDEKTEIIAREYERKSSGYSYTIKSTFYKDGVKYIKNEDTFRFINNCVLVATLPDGRCIFDDLSKNFNVLMKNRSRVPALYMTNEGFNPENNPSATLGDAVEGYSKELVLKTYYNRPASSNNKASVIEFGNE